MNGFKFKLTFWKTILGALLLTGIYVTILRFIRGLGASTNLSDAFPWGLWIGFDVMCGVMLAAGGFTLTATVYIFNLKRFKPIVRPAVLTAFLGYVLVAVALLYDLGRSYRIWHPIVLWNPRSVMFEVAWCVMLYLTVLALEFAAAVFERLGMEKLLRIQHAITIPLVIAGVLLSTLHQSSLGSLYLIVPEKLHPYWYTPLLPLLFFVSAVCVGLAMTIFESSMSARHFRKQLEMPLMMGLGRALLVGLIAYSVLRFHDLFHRGAWKLLARGGDETWMFLLEVTLGLLLPIVLLLIPKVRESSGGLYISSVLALFGFVANRMNVAITGMEASAATHYFPKWTEWVITGCIIGVGFAMFALAVKYLPVFAPEGVRLETAEAREPALAVMSHASP